MPIFTQRPMMANYIISEADGYRSRDMVDVVGDATIVLPAGTVLGRVTTGAAAAVVKPGNTGNATIGAVVPTSDALPGAYTIRFTSATAYNVFRPNNVLIGTGTTGVAFAAELGFTITAGGTPMAVGDGFNVAVTAAPGDWRRHTLGNTDGTQNAAGVLFEEVQPNTTVKRTVHRRACELNGAHLVHSASATTAQIAAAVAALAALNIIVR